MHKSGFYKLLSIDFILISSRFPCGRRAQRFAKRAQKDACVFCRATATLNIASRPNGSNVIFECKGSLLPPAEAGLSPHKNLLLIYSYLLNSPLGAKHHAAKAEESKLPSMRSKFQDLMSRRKRRFYFKLSITNNL